MTITIDDRSRDLRAAEHLVHDLDEVLGGLPSGPSEDAGLLVSTHVLTAPARFVLALSWPGGPDGADGPDEGEVADALTDAFPDADVRVGGPEPVLAAHRDRTDGRLARYPGRERIERRLTVAEVVAHSCVDEVVGLAGVTPGPDTELDLTDFARPTWRAGRCTLLVQHGAGVLVPFEVRDQIPCCTTH